MRTLGIAWFLLLLLAGGVIVYAYSGLYDVGADAPHSRPTLWLLGVARDHSVDRRVRTIDTPPLGDAKQLAIGAEHYAEMCTGCHLAPGLDDTELRAGLYPQPPDFATDGVPLRAEELFWVIKHGLKMTGMPAWGRTHDDETIWAMVAFVRTLPEMSPEEYRRLTAKSAVPAGEQSQGTHDHSKAQTHADSRPADEKHKQ
jgi:mono/diheme cytochrome c family protein